MTPERLFEIKARYDLDAQYGQVSHYDFQEMLAYIEQVMEDIQAKDLRIKRLEEQLIQNIDFEQGTI